MPRSPVFDTDDVTLAELLANGKRYRVPPFQRDYSWRADNWEELWTDVVSPEIDHQQHFMGTIVLQKT